MRKARKRKIRQNRAGKICVSCIVIVLALILSVQIVRLYEKNEQYKVQQKQLEAQLEEENARAEDLKEQEEYVGSDEYVEDTARGKLGMAHKDEIVFKEK